jgi:hypothetical protein
MTMSARKVLEEFQALSAAEQQELAAEILRRSAGAGELSEAALTELADELFRAYDAEETAGAEGGPR